MPRPSAVLAACWLLATVLPLPSGHAQARRGKKYAVLVGVKEYRHRDLGDLRYTENDVVELARVLRRAGYEVSLLCDSEGEKDQSRAPTKKNVERALEAVLGKAAKRDTVVLAFAGHGLQTEPEKGKKEEKGDAYFCPREANPHDPKTLVSLREVYRRLEESGAGVRLMLVDACRNDPRKGGDRKALSRSGVTAGTAPRPPEGVAVLFSCSRGQVSWEHEDLKHGIFFHYVLEGLRGKARDDEGVVTWDGLALYVKRQVTRAVPRLVKGASQQPNEIKDGQGEPPVLLAAPDEAERLYRQGRAAFDGLGRTVSWEEGLRCYRQAAKLGHPLAQVALKSCQFAGQGMPKDEREARKVPADVVVRVREAAEKGDPAAQGALGGMYFKGLGVPQDDRQALAWLRKAAEQGDPGAQMAVGSLYALGRGAEKDGQQALRWCRKAADQGLTSAKTFIGLMYMLGLGVAKDGKEAMRWYRRGAEQDDPVACYGLGVLYSRGPDVKRDYQEAVRWYRRAVAQGLSTAQNDLGLAYADGLGVTANQKESLRWIRLAAEQNLPQAQYNLAWAYEKGLGVKKDEKEAVRWYRKAAEGGLPDAKERLRELTKRPARGKRD